MATDRGKSKRELWPPLAPATISGDACCCARTEWKKRERESEERDAEIGRINKNRDSSVDGDRRPVVLSLAPTAAAVNRVASVGRKRGRRRITGAGREKSCWCRKRTGKIRRRRRR